ncbi:MAG: excinuclease ABC subunit A, partial [Dehalococcoidia bacterium]
VIGQSDTQSRLSDSIETALKLGEGTVMVAVIDGKEFMFSEKFACADCGISLGEIEPRSFSFNSPHGACPDCTGLGVKMEFEPDLVIPNKKLTLAEGAINPYQWQTWYFSQLEDVARRYHFSLNTPVAQLTPEQLEMVLFGEGGERFKMKNRFGKQREYTAGFEGVIPRLERLYKDSESEQVRSGIARYMVATMCPTCGGKRLKPEALGVLIDDNNIAHVSAMSVVDSLDWVERLAGDNTPLSGREQLIAKQILKELESRLGFLKDVGLDYLSIDRASATLSGGESQRIRLATQIGSGLMGVLYICDEPTVGLHPADDSRLIETLKRLRDLGNSILVVEHDEAMMRAADWIIDLGPGAGEQGGHVIVSGTLEDVLNCQDSVTGAYLSGRKSIPLPEKRRTGNGKEMVIRGARQNNLKNIDVHIPLGRLVCIAGVSGSGKSTLVNEILFKKMAQAFNGARAKPGDHDGIDGLEYIDKVIAIDQSPIGRTPRSNPATFTGAFTPIRDLFATVPEARVRGYNAGRFSFNVKGGRCEACRGEGYIEIEMQFLPDVTVPCEVCHGQRYSREVLDIRFKGQNIAEVLNMTVDHALDYFSNIPSIKAKLKSMHDVGLGYIRLGQPAPTLSGGEAQRIKLASELARRAIGHTLYILDEPTTGLAFDDIAALLQVMQRLVESGNSVIVIEHQLDIIKNADWL